MNLLQIDELVRSQHYWLDPGDLCYYFMEYTSYAGFRFSEANDLIQNFKKPMDRQGKPEWSYKQQAILRITKMLIESIPSQTNLSHILFVPIPPSKRKTDELYDDRIVQVLSAFCKTYQGDLREILSMRYNIDASHTTTQRPKPAEIEANLLLDEGLCREKKETIFLVDDVIASGAHFKACQHKLQECFPKSEIKGLFIARRAVAVM